MEIATTSNGHTVQESDGQPYTNGLHEPTAEELERELPVVLDGQIPVGELVSRTVQAIYAELSELAETLPNMSDGARKRTLANWVVSTKKQVVKLYAVLKWARDADFVQKAMNVTAFLMDQNQQFEDAISGLKYARESLDPARLRNHDLLTSLDVLTTASYRRLPTAIKKLIIPPTPLTNEEVAKTLADVEDVIRFRLKMTEIIPSEMSAYRIAEGRVYFVAPKLFEASLCVRGAQKDDGWFFVNVEFLFTVGGDRTGMQEFPRKPTGILKRHIADEADNRLAFYLPLPQDQVPPPEMEVPPRPQLPDGVADAPLVRVFNFLQMMSLSYQLEILCYQVTRLRSLGWADYLTVGMTNNRQTMTISYWIRKPPPSQPGRPQQRSKIPSLGGTLTISIVRVEASPQNKANRSPKARVLAELQEKSKLDGARPSDEVEPLRFDVKWAPEKGALGVNISAEDAKLPAGELMIDSDNLDVESLLRRVITKHIEGILRVIEAQLQHGPTTRSMFSPPGEVTLVIEDGMHALRTHLCADEVVVITIDPRTGRLNLRDTGDLAAAGRGRRFAVITDKLNESPGILSEALIRLKFGTITDLAEQKASYLGLQSYRTRNFSREELQKLGPAARGMLYIQLAKFPSHYLVLVITDEDFRYALISVEVLPNTMFHNMVMKDIGWLDVRRVHGDEIVVTHRNSDNQDVAAGQKRKRDVIDEAGRSDVADQYSPRFNLETQVLRELYAYCCARVAYYKIEQQFKSRTIPYTVVNSTNVAHLPELAHLQSSIARSIPALCVPSSVFLSGAPAAEAAMPNIRVIPLNWWSERQAQVVTCVKLKYVQQPVGKRAGSSNVIRPSKRIIYDTTEAIVSFLSEDVDKCVDEFLEEWARVSKMVVIAREVGQMSRDKHWTDIRLLSFDLQTVEFAYAADYTVSITCTDQLSPTGGSYELFFSRIPDPQIQYNGDDDDRLYNPHEDLEPYLRNLLRHGRLAHCLQRLVHLLRDTLPIVAELEDIRVSTSQTGDNVDVFPKAAGWFRVLYGDFRHALDFRLMTGARVVILDGSHSLFRAETQGPSPATLAARTSGQRVSSVALGRNRAADSNLVLRPIPDFAALIVDAVRDARSEGVSGQIAPVDIGVLCSSTTVRAVAKSLHRRILQKISNSGKRALRLCSM